MLVLQINGVQIDLVTTVSRNTQASDSVSAIWKPLVSSLASHKRKHDSLQVVYHFISYSMILGFKHMKTNNLF